MILISNFLKNLYLTPRSMRGQAFIFIVLQELRSYMQFHLLVTIFHYMSQCLNPNTDFFLVRIFMHSDWIQSISPYSVRMRENTDQKNSEYGQFSCSGRYNFAQCFHKHLLYRRNFSQVYCRVAQRRIQNTVTYLRWRFWRQ